MYKARLPPSRRVGHDPAGPHVPACRAPQFNASPQRRAAGHAGTRSARQHPYSSGWAHMEPHLISSAVYIPKDTPTSRRHGTTLGGLMANEQLFPGRQLVPLSRWKCRATGSTTRSKLRDRRSRAVPKPRRGGTALPPAGAVVPPAFPEASAREQHGGAAGRGWLLAAGAVAGSAVPPSGRAGELPVRDRREGRAAWRRHRGRTDGRAVLAVWGERRERLRRRSAPMRRLSVVEAAWPEGAPCLGLLSGFGRLFRGSSLSLGSSEPPWRGFERLSGS